MPPMPVAPTSPIFCRHCGYNVHGLPENRCAECGRAFDPADRKSYAVRASSHGLRRWARRIVAALTAWVLLAGIGVFSLWLPWHRHGAAIRMVRRCGGTIDIKTLGPNWLKTVLGQRGGFLLERVGPRCDLSE